MMHTIALCIWGFAGFRVLCKNCLASFIARLITFVMSCPLQSLLSLCNWCLISLCFFLIQSCLVFLHLAHCSSVSVCRCFVLRSRSVLLRLAPCSCVSFCRCFVTHSRIVLLHLALSSWVSTQRFAFLESLSFSLWASFFSCDIIRRSFRILSVAGLAGFLPPKNYQISRHR